MLTRADHAVKHARDEARLAERSKFETWVEDQYKLCQIIDRPEDPTKLLHQLGRKMSVKEFEGVLKKLNPSLSIKPIPSKPNYAKVIWGVRKNPISGRVEPNVVCSCENRFMPEFSLMERIEKEMPVMVDHMTPETPAFITVPACGGEIMRGWRTVLVTLVKEGAITVADVENVVGHADRPGWANHIGRREVKNLLF